MRLIEKTIKHGRASIFNIYPLGDFHLGSIDCSEHEIINRIRAIEVDPFAYWIGMGDICDCILKDDKRFRIGGLAESWLKKDDIVESQRKRAKEILSPVKDKCLAFLSGNHEEAIHCKHQDDIARHIAEDLGLPFAGFSCFAHLTFYRTEGDDGKLANRHSIMIHAWHGAGSAQTEGARLMRLMHLVNEFQADIYLMGHLHAITLYAPDRLGITNHKIKSNQVIALTTGSFLRGYSQEGDNDYREPSYVEEKGYKPARLGCPIIHIHPQDKTFTVEV